MKKNPAAILSQYIFIFNLAKCVNDKAVEKTFCKLLLKVWCLLHVQILCTVKLQKFELRFFEILANSK